VPDIDKKDLGRNDPCHCGSGKKYKACHLEADEAAERAARQKAQDAAPAAEAAAAPADTPAEPPRGRKKKHATAQPWKGGQSGPRSVPRFNAPRRSGGS
jgi:preprotein translocase subunit SecA